MDKEIRIQAEKLNIKHRRKRIWYRLLSVPVSIVVFVTTYAMILPAITLEATPDTYCGQEEHIHSDECYETPGVPEHREIKCTAARELAEGEYIVHTHNDICFSGGELICTLPEQTEHTHTEDCYENGELVCEKLTPVVHQHTNDCVVTVSAVAPKGLICEKTEHTHTEACFEKPASDNDGTAASENGTTAENGTTTESGTAAVTDEIQAADGADVITADIVDGADAGIESNSTPISVVSVNAVTREEQPEDRTDASSISDAVDGRELSTQTTSSGLTVYGTAYSDKSTSNIESEFAGTETDDGKSLADKSVIYGADDYGAFSSYSDNTFSVTLSALGQQYETSSTETVRTPLDVVFILDTSRSMSTEGRDSNKTYRDRCEKAVSTLNELAKYVMTINPDNRFGIATFSSVMTESTYNNGVHCKELLPIDYYPNSTSGDILTFTKAGDTSTGFSGSNVRVNTSVSGTQNENLTYFEGRTYTTAGYYQAYEMLKNTTERTVTTAGGNTVQRVPVVIMITDGLVTHSSSGTNEYEYSADYYQGTGGTMTEHDLFYTILSAYHYKQLIGQEYGDVKLYTVGVGDEVVNKGYDMQTSLNPTAENIANLSTGYSNVQNYLQNKTGFPTSYTALYGTEFYFCDGTYTTDTFNPELTTQLKTFIAENSGDFIYTSSQKSSTDVRMTDIIGAGMEIKSDFVLRYDGTNYTMSYVKTENGEKVYRYTGTEKVKANQLGDEVALSGITVRVGTTADGNQKVTWDIPAELLPEYTHAKNAAWYYKMLPVRLIYQVGLSDTELQRVQSLTDSSAQLVYYTNLYDGSTDNATAVLTPKTDDDGEAAANPYYKSYTGETKYKDANTTATAPTYRDVTLSSGSGQVFYALGNNGKLVFSSKKANVDGAKTSVTAKKVWQDSDGNTVTDTASLPTSYITAVLYADGNLYSSNALNAENNWEYTFENLPKYWTDGTEIVWTVDEGSVPKGYDKTVAESGGGDIAVTSLEDGEIYSFANGSYWLTNANSSTSVTAGTSLSENAKWQAEAQSDGTFKLKNVATGNYLGIQRTRSGRNYYYYTIAGDGNSSTGTSYSYFYEWSLTGNKLYQSSASRYVDMYSSVSASKSGTTFTVTKSAPKTFIITNTAKASVSLTVTKRVNAPDTSGEFSFEVTWDSLDTPVTFTLKRNESYTVENIPNGAVVTVRELNTDGYCVTFRTDNDRQTGLTSYSFTADSDATLTVTNTASVILPETGGIGSHIFIYGGLGIMLAAVVTGYLLRRKYGKEGE